MYWVLDQYHQFGSQVPSLGQLEVDYLIADQPCDEEMHILGSID